MGWLRRLLGLEREDGAASVTSNGRSVSGTSEEFQRREAQIREAGLVDGVHYVDYVETVKQLKRDRRHAEAIELLLRLIDATEAEAKTAQQLGYDRGVAPAYYKELAIVYRKEKRFTDEVGILERYERQPKARGEMPAELARRLVKARELAGFATADFSPSSTVAAHSDTRNTTSKPTQNREPLTKAGGDKATFTAIDFETANSDRASVCAIGLVRVENGKVVQKLHQLIRPDPLHFDSRNVAIHGITEDDVANAPTFSQYWPCLRTTVSGPLVAHNAAFDMSVLRCVLDQCGIPYPEFDYFCTKVIAQQVWPERPSYRLDSLARMIEVPLNHHNAEEDARACAFLALAACRHVNVSCLYDLRDALELRVGHLFDGGYSPCGASKRIRRRAHSQAESNAVDNSHAISQGQNDSVFTGLAFAFTGPLSSMSRAEAMQAVVARGGAFHKGVKRGTDYLVVGRNAFIGYQAGHKSSKIGKAESMRERGFSIAIISESEFLNML